MEETDQFTDEMQEPVEATALAAEVGDEGVEDFDATALLHSFSNQRKQKQRGPCALCGAQKSTSWRKHSRVAGTICNKCYCRTVRLFKQVAPNGVQMKPARSTHTAEPGNANANASGSGSSQGMAAGTRRATSAVAVAAAAATHHASDGGLSQLERLLGSLVQGAPGSTAGANAPPAGGSARVADGRQAIPSFAGLGAAQQQQQQQLPLGGGGGSSGGTGVLPFQPQQLAQLAYLLGEQQEQQEQRQQQQQLLELQQLLQLEQLEKSQQQQRQGQQQGLLAAGMRQLTAGVQHRFQPLHEQMQQPVRPRATHAVSGLAVQPEPAKPRQEQGALQQGQPTGGAAAAATAALAAQQQGQGVEAAAAGVGTGASGAAGAGAVAAAAGAGAALPAAMSRLEQLQELCWYPKPGTDAAEVARSATLAWERCQQQLPSSQQQPLAVLPGLRIVLPGSSSVAHPVGVLLLRAVLPPDEVGRMTVVLRVVVYGTAGILLECWEGSPANAAGRLGSDAVLRLQSWNGGAWALVFPNTQQSALSSELELFREIVHIPVQQLATLQCAQAQTGSSRGENLLQAPLQQLLRQVQRELQQQLPGVQTQQQQQQPQGGQAQQQQQQQQLQAALSVGAQQPKPPAAPLATTVELKTVMSGGFGLQLSQPPSGTPNSPPPSSPADTSYPNTLQEQRSHESGAGGSAIQRAGPAGDSNGSGSAHCITGPAAPGLHAATNPFSAPNPSGAPAAGPPAVDGGALAAASAILGAVPAPAGDAAAAAAMLPSLLLASLSMPSGLNLNSTGLPSVPGLLDTILGSYLGRSQPQ